MFQNRDRGPLGRNAYSSLEFFPSPIKIDYNLLSTYNLHISMPYGAPDYIVNFRDQFILIAFEWLLIRPGLRTQRQLFKKSLLRRFVNLSTWDIAITDQTLFTPGSSDSDNKFRSFVSVKSCAMRPEILLPTCIFFKKRYLHLLRSVSVLVHKISFNGMIAQ